MLFSSIYRTLGCLNFVDLQPVNALNTMGMLDNEFKYYLDHQDILVEKYNGKYWVIKEDQIIGIYDAEATAYYESEKKHELGTFLIQFCESGDKSYTQTYHSRVNFINFGKQKPQSPTLFPKEKGASASHKFSYSLIL